MAENKENLGEENLKENDMQDTAEGMEDENLEEDVSCDEETQEETEQESDEEHPENMQPNEEEAKEEGGAKKSFFKKKKDKKDEQIEALNDKVKRQMAEFENFRKRSEKEKSQMYDMGAKTIIEKMLPIVDNFERGLSAVPEEQKDDAFVTGMDKIYKQLLTELEAVGVMPIEAVGEPFDPEFHNAVMQVENGEYESGTVAQELQKGYKYKDSVVRHSMVAVVS